MTGKFTFYLSDDTSYTTYAEAGSYDSCLDKAKADVKRKYPNLAITDWDEKYYDEDETCSDY